jgi:hypothetical protein
MLVKGQIKPAIKNTTQKTWGLASSRTFYCSVDPTCAQIYVNTYNSALHLLGEERKAPLRSTSQTNYSYIDSGLLPESLLLADEEKGSI